MSFPANGKNAFETAYTKYADMLYRIALSHTAVREDAEDVVHDVFIKYVQYVQDRADFSDEEYERAWLIRVTVNRCCDLLRRGNVRRYVPLDEIEEVPDDECNSFEESGILSSVSVLPQKYKSVIVLHYLEGYSVEETAKILKLSISAVKMRLSRGREFLKSSLGEKL